MRTRCDCIQTGSTADVITPDVSRYQVELFVILCSVCSAASLCCYLWRICGRDGTFSVFCSSLPAPTSSARWDKCVPTSHYVTASSLPDTAYIPLGLVSVSSGQDCVFRHKIILYSVDRRWRVVGLEQVSNCCVGNFIQIQLVRFCFFRVTQLNLLQLRFYCAGWFLHHCNCFWC